MLHRGRWHEYIMRAGRQTQWRGGAMVIIVVTANWARSLQGILVRRWEIPMLRYGMAQTTIEILRRKWRKGAAAESRILRIEMNRNVVSR